MAQISSYSPGYQRLAVDQLEGDKRTEDEIVIPSRREGYGVFLNKKPHTQRESFQKVLVRYRLDDLGSALLRYVADSHGRRVGNLLRGLLKTPEVTVETWTKLRIRLPTVHNMNSDSLIRTIEALPPSASTSLPHGHCHCALICMEDDADDVGIKGHQIAQVRLIFRLKFATNHQHPLHMKALAYVQWFSKTRRTPEPDISMYRVDRRLRPDGGPEGDVIPVEAIARFVQLIPRFGRNASLELRAWNSMDRCRSYWVNSFADKESFLAIW